MADQTGGDAAPANMETKNMAIEPHTDPNVVRPAPVPYGDSTHIDRGEGHTAPAATEDKPAESGAEQKTATRKTPANKS